MAIGNSVSNNFLSTFVDSIDFFDCGLRGVLPLIEIRQLSGSGKNMPILRTGKQEQPAEQQYYNNRRW